MKGFQLVGASKICKYRMVLNYMSKSSFTNILVRIKEYNL